MVVEKNNKVEDYKFKKGNLNFAVVGHVEWINFLKVDQLPKPGVISHSEKSLEYPAGGGSIIAKILSDLTLNQIHFFTSLGNDDYGNNFSSGGFLSYEKNDIRERKINTIKLANQLGIKPSDLVFEVENNSYSDSTDILIPEINDIKIKEIAEIMLQEVFARLQDKGIKLNVTDAFKERLVEEGYNPSYGARPLRRAVMRLLEDSLAEEVLSGRIKDGDRATVDIDDNNKVTINISSEESSQELASANF